MDEFMYTVSHAGILILLASATQIWFSAGLFVVASPLFFSIGIFVSTYMSVEMGWNPWISIAAACAVGSLSFVLVLPFLIRLHGIHLAMATIALAEMARIFGLNLTTLTGGAEGRIVPIVVEFRHVLIALALAFALAFAVQSGKRGHRLSLLRHDRRVATLIGIRSRRTEVIFLLLGATVAILAGGMYAHLAGFVSPQEYGLGWAIDAIAIAVIGGRFKWYGPLLGGTVLLIIPEQLHLSTILMDFVSGVLLIAVLILFPSGLAESVARASSGITRLMSGKKSKQVVADTHSFADLDTTLNASHHQLEARSITVSYGGVVAVDDVSFETTPGAVLGIIGPNGAGKTSLINVVTGLARPASGTVTNGTAKITNAYRAARHRIRRTFQHLQLVDSLTVLENIELGRTGQGSDRALVNTIIGSLGLSEFIRRSPQELSLGQRRLTELARALVAEPEVLLLDEPTSGCDEESIRLMRDAIKTYSQRGGSTVVISHDVSFVVDVADEVMLLANGRKVKVLPADQLLVDPDVRVTYLGGDLVASTQ